MSTQTFTFDETEYQTINRALVERIHALRKMVRELENDPQVEQFETEHTRATNAYMSLQNIDRHKQESYPHGYASAIKLVYNKRIEVQISLYRDVNGDVIIKNATPGMRHIGRDKLCASWGKVDFNEWMRNALSFYDEVRIV